MELACLAQLERSHRRHDEVMANLLAAARRLVAVRPEDGDVQAVHSAVGFFGRSVTRHFLDEEGSVFPRLSTRRPELAEALAALSGEHPGQIALHGEIAEVAKQLDGIDGNEVRPTVGKLLLELAEQLAKQHEAHVAREDEIFHGAHEALTAEDDREITAEMEMRRDRDGERAGGGHGGGGGGGRGGGGGGGRGKAKSAKASVKKIAAKAVKKKTAPKKPAPKKSAKKKSAKKATR